MAYTTIDKSSSHFKSKIWDGTGSSNALTGVGFQPDWLWMKRRDGAEHHIVSDSVTGLDKQMYPSHTSGQDTVSQTVTAVGADGFTLGTNSQVNGNGQTHAGWLWKAGGTTPSQTYTVKVVSDSGNKYRFDDFGTSAVTLDLQEGGTYTFDQSDSSNSGHPLRFSTTSNGTHGGGSEYTTGVTTNGTPGSSGAYTRITVASGAPTLYYYCTQHSGMGGQVNTNSLFGSSNFAGSIQSTISTNSTAGFSIIKWTADNQNASTIGHGLGVKPDVILMKETEGASGWVIGGFGLDWGGYLTLQTDSTFSNNGNDTTGDGRMFNQGGNEPTTTKWYTNSGAIASQNNTGMVAYAFSEITGYSKFGSYIGNASVDGPFVYTGFKPSFVLVKNTSASGNWFLQDTERAGYNGANYLLKPNTTGAEDTGTHIDILSNGFKTIVNTANCNGNGNTMVYMAFAEAPLVGSNDIPATAR